ncbi:MAG: hypothetical protein JHC87_01245, partial [Thermoleophilaceae bacterium]|nr:hypothetical protein [Thermoleophilaceae bacterium]
NGKTTQEVEHPFKILQIWGLELPIASLAFTERGFLGKIRMFDRIEGATTSQRVVELESTEFNEKFKLEVADSADEVWIRRIFDPETIQALVADTFEIPNISYYDRCFWLVEGGHYKAKELDAMLTWQGNAVQAIRHLARVQSL